MIPFYMGHYVEPRRDPRATLTKRADLNDHERVLVRYRSLRQTHFKTPIEALTIIDLEAGYDTTEQRVASEYLHKARSRVVSDEPVGAYWDWGKTSEVRQRRSEGQQEATHDYEWLT